jgi:hypothetical protein
MRENEAISLNRMTVQTRVAILKDTEIYLPNIFKKYVYCSLIAEATNITSIWQMYTRECIQKFPDWPPGARTANGTSSLPLVQLYRYFVS